MIERKKGYGYDNTNEVKLDSYLSINFIDEASFSCDIVIFDAEHYFVSICLYKFYMQINIKFAYKVFLC